MILEYLNKIRYIIQKNSKILQKGGLGAQMILNGLYYSTSSVVQILENAKDPNPKNAYYQQVLIGGGLEALKAEVDKIVDLAAKLKTTPIPYTTLKDMAETAIASIKSLGELKNFMTLDPKIAIIQTNLEQIVTEIADYVK
jgi:hypothetical protein